MSTSPMLTWPLLAGMVTGMVHAAPGPLPLETVDRYAQRLFEQSASAMPMDVPAPNVAPARSPTSGSEVAVLFISGAGKRRSAYLVIDAVYGKTVQPNERLGNWRVLSIGEDYVDIERDGQQRRLLLAVRGAGAIKPATTEE